MQRGAQSGVGLFALGLVSLGLRFRITVAWVIRAAHRSDDFTVSRYFWGGLVFGVKRFR